MNPAPERKFSMEPGEEAGLILAAQGGDTRAFEQLVRAYQRPIYRLAWGITRNAADADDLAQETFVRAYQAIGRFRVGEPIYPWLSRIAINLAYSLFRRRKRRPETALEPLIEAGRQWGVDDDPAEGVLERERREHLGAAFDELSKEHRAVLVLRVIEDMSYEQIGTTLGIPAGTVMSRLSRARAELLAKIERRTGEKP